MEELVIQGSKQVTKIVLHSKKDLSGLNAGLLI